MLQLSRFVRKPVFGFPTRPDKKRPVPSQKMARGLQFRIEEAESGAMYVAKIKALIN